jgi:hypothetical protein
MLPERRPVQGDEVLAALADLDCHPGHEVQRPLAGRARSEKRQQLRPEVFVGQGDHPALHRRNLALAVHQLVQHFVHGSFL